MARKNQKNPQAAQSAANQPTQSSPKAAPKTQQVAGSWIDENWESWLRPVTYIGIAGVVFLLYYSGVLSDLYTGVLGIFTLCGYVWLATLSAEAPRFPEGKKRVLYALGGLVALLTLAPVVLAIWPGAPLAMGSLKQKGESLNLKEPEEGDGVTETGTYLVVAGGSFATESRGDKVIDYILEGSNGEKKSVMRGKVEQRLEQTSSRRGVAGQALKSHSQDKATMVLDPETPLTLVSDLNPGDLTDGLRIAVFHPPIGGLWLLLGASVFYVILLAYETSNIAIKGRGYLAAGGGIAISGALVFCLYSTPYTPFTTTSDMARIALGSGMIGGIFGSFAGLFVGYLIGRVIKRPPAPEETQEA